MILINKIFCFFLFLLILTSCSFNKNSSFWSKTETIKKEKILIITELFKEKKVHEKEINPNLRIKLTSKPKSNNFANKWMRETMHT